MTARPRTWLLVALAACGGNSHDDAALVQKPLVLERFSPPQHTSYDVFLAAHADVIVLQTRISRDAGATWAPIDASLGSIARVAITGTTVATYSTSRGLVRWDLASDAITPVAAAPSFASERSWRLDPSGRFAAFDGVENAIAVERGASWVASALPQPSPTEVRPFLQDLESNGSTWLAVSAWGVHRSTDDTATWQLVTASVPDAGRDLLVLPDGRFVLAGGATTYVFDGSGVAAGTKPGFGVANDEAMACDDGSIVAGGRVTRDVGATWQPLIAPSDLDTIAERSGCGGGHYWVLSRSTPWGYRLVRFESPGMPGVAVGNFDAAASAWAAGGPPLVRDGAGSFLTAGLAWHEGAAAWTLRETPPRTWASGDTLFGVATPTFFLSHDGGATWSAVAGAGLAGEPEAFAQTAEGALVVARFTGETAAGTDTWHSVVWRSSDNGGSWTIAYDATATRTGDEVTGEVHRFVGIAGDGAWVATDAVSHDAGATWTPTDTTGDQSLAFLTPDGRLVTQLPVTGATQDVWRVYEDGGLGELAATYRIEIEGVAVPASQLRGLAFDEAGYVYTTGGAPYVQVWRSAQPL
ncbi:MAG: sialidase family protein [Kofleriaceae bacterium]